MVGEESVSGKYFNLNSELVVGQKSVFVNNFNLNSKLEWWQGIKSVFGKYFCALYFFYLSTEVSHLQQNGLSNAAVQLLRFRESRKIACSPSKTLTKINTNSAHANFS